jgi:hypothetical protein
MAALLSEYMLKTTGRTLYQRIIDAHTLRKVAHHAATHLDTFTNVTMQRSK